MKILHYISDFSLTSETFIYDLIINLEQYKLDNYILTHTRSLEKERPFSKVKVIDDNVSFYKKVYYKVFKYKFNIRNHRKIKDYIYELNPDIIHAHFGPNGIKIFNLLKKLNINIPLIIAFHGKDVNTLPIYDKKYKKYLIEISKQDNIQFTTPSAFLKNKLVDLGVKSDKINIISNMCNREFLKKSKTRIWEFGNTLELLIVGRLHELKGHQYLINAFSKVIDYYPNARLTIIGSGALENKLVKLVKSLKIADKVNFVGKLNHMDIIDFLLKTDLYIQPSIVTNNGEEESFSVSTLEAQCMGVPAIVSNIGGLPEVVLNNKTGFLVEEKNVEMIFAKIKYYIDYNDIYAYHCQNSIYRCKENFNTQKTINILVNTVYKYNQV